MRILLVRDIAEQTIRALLAGFRQVPGYHGALVDHSVDHNAIPTGWVTFRVRGTEKAESRCRAIVIDAEAFATDQNADHDHDECVAQAAKLGVPATYAHTPESYLSA